MQKLLILGGAAGLVAGGLLLTAGLMRVGERPAELTWRDPEIKSALMTFGYKVYGNPKVEFGRHYLSKLVFQNVGEHPIKDFSISYRIDDHVPWTEPEELHEIPAKFTLVKLYYPKLPPQVTKIRNATNATFRFRIRWMEEGRQREESFARDIVLRGVNEMAYCDLPESELRTQNAVLSWLDFFNASQFAIAMVTPNDPVVNLYASEITKLAGGTVAGVEGGAKEIGRLCRITYEYMQATELRYTGDSGVPANFDNIATLVQTVRLPRDVIVNNQGLCVELALLWSSILEHLGVDAALVFRPGHAYVIAYSIKQGIPVAQGLPIECTAITPRAVDRDAPVPFDDAVKMAVEDVKKFQQDGRIMILPVKNLQAMGFTAPELADIDTDKLAETLAKRRPRPAEAPVPPVAAPGETTARFQARPPVQTPATPGGMKLWRHPQGLVSISFPADFVSMVEPDDSPTFLLLSVGNPGTTVGCEVMQIRGTDDPAQAINYLAAYFNQMGAMLQVTGRASMNDGSVKLSGTTTSVNGSVRWICLARPSPGGVLLVSAGSHPNMWNTQVATIEGILATARFK